MNKFILLSVLTFMLIGCGGSSAPKTVAKNTKLKGVAVDDLILNGVVRAYAAGNESVSLATGRTSSSDGSYALNISHDGVVVVEVTCDASSQMKPISGPAVQCESGLKLHSAVPVTPSSGEVKVNISPLSELVVRQMQENGTSKADFEAAQNNISMMFGVDPINENPTQNVKYGKIVDSIHQLAETKNSSIMAVVNGLGADLNDGEAGDDGNISQELAVAMKNEGVSNNLTDKSGAYKPNPSDGTFSDIQVAKTFFNELRTQAMSLTDYKNSGTPGFLDNEAENLGGVLDDVVLDTSGMAKNIFNIFDTIKKLEDANQTQRTDGNIAIQKIDANLGDYNYTITKGTTTWSGNFLIPDLKDVNLSDFDPIALNIHGEFPISNPLPNGSENKQTFDALVEITKTITGANLVLNTMIGSNGTGLAISPLNIDVAYGVEGTGEDQKPINVSARLNLLSITGITRGYSLDGNITTSDYVTNTTLENNNHIIPSKLLFTGGIKNTITNGDIKGSIAVELKNATDINLSKHSEDKPLFKVDISGAIGMPSRPVMNSEIHYDINNTSTTAYNNLQLSYSYDSTAINGVATFDKEGDNGVVALANQDGISVDFNVANGDVVYSTSSVKRNSKVIGELQERNGVPVVKYVDGSFESLP